MQTQKHRNPKNQWALKSIPSFVLPQDRDQLLSNLDATKMLLDAGMNIGNTKLYKAFRDGAFTGYQIDAKIYFIKSEIEAAIKKWPRTVPRDQGYYPSVFRQKGSRMTQKFAVTPIPFTYFISVA